MTWDWLSLDLWQTICIVLLNLWVLAHVYQHRHEAAERRRRDRAFRNWIRAMR